MSEAFGRIKATLEKRGQRIEDFYATVAAHAAATGATLVTANAADEARARLAHGGLARNRVALV